MTIMPNAADSPLDQFIDFLYEGLEGLIYVAAKDPNNPMEWKQEFFHYPNEVEKVKTVLVAASKSHEIYIAPALFKEPKATKESFKVSNVAWADFDGNTPEYESNPPSLVVQSSLPEHTHAYWKLIEPIYDINEIEAINHGIAYTNGADTSGWDGTQVLRAPGTFNHKRDLPVILLNKSNALYDKNLFDTFINQPKVQETWEIGNLPSPEEVILKYSFTPDLILLLKKNKEDIPDRSVALTNLAYGCCQLGMSDNEVFVILLTTANRWEKFKGRKDKERQLAKIIQVARSKYPSDLPTEDEEPFTYTFGFDSFLNTEISLDWIIEPMLAEQGSMLMVGPSGIGKTQFSIQFMIHIALGKDYLHYKIPYPKKVLFLSLEMDHGSLKKFLETIVKDLDPSEIELLETNFIIVPHGEPWALNTPVGQEYLIQIIEALEPDGIFIDSVGSAVKGSISTDENVQPLLDFNDKIRKRYKLFLWYIHHMRKSTNGGAHTSDQDDIYGNQYLLNRATSSYGLLRAKNGNIRVRNFKLRLAAKETDYLIQRTENLNFVKLNDSIDTLIETISYVKPEEDKGPLEDKAGKFSL